jgi:hypothetical protein
MYEILMNVILFVITVLFVATTALCLFTVITLIKVGVQWFWSNRSPNQRASIVANNIYLAPGSRLD